MWGRSILLPCTQINQGSVLRHKFGNLGTKVGKQLNLIPSLVVVGQPVDLSPQVQAGVVGKQGGREETLPGAVGLDELTACQSEQFLLQERAEGMRELTPANVEHGARCIGGERQLGIWLDGEVSSTQQQGPRIIVKRSDLISHKPRDFNHRLDLGHSRSRTLQFDC